MTPGKVDGQKEKMTPKNILIFLKLGKSVKLFCYCSIIYEQEIPTDKATIRR